MPTHMPHSLNFAKTAPLTTLFLPQSSHLLFWEKKIAEQLGVQNL